MFIQIIFCSYIASSRILVLLRKNKYDHVFLNSVMLSCSNANRCVQTFVVTNLTQIQQQHFKEGRLINVELPHKTLSWKIAKIERRHWHWNNLTSQCVYLMCYACTISLDYIMVGQCQTSFSHIAYCFWCVSVIWQLFENKSCLWQKCVWKRSKNSLPSCKQECTCITQ